MRVVISSIISLAIVAADTNGHKLPSLIQTRATNAARVAGSQGAKSMDMSRAMAGKGSHSHVLPSWGPPLTSYNLGSPQKSSCDAENGCNCEWPATSYTSSSGCVLVAHEFTIGSGLSVSDRKIIGGYPYTGPSCEACLSSYPEVNALRGHGIKTFDNGDNVVGKIVCVEIPKQENAITYVTVDPRHPGAKTFCSMPTKTLTFSDYGGEWLNPNTGDSSESLTAGSSWSSSNAKAYTNAFEAGLSVTATAKVSFLGSGGSMSSTASTSFTHTVASTLTDTKGGSTTFECTSRSCPDGTLYQWVASAQPSSGGGRQSVRNCDFVCVGASLPGDTKPKCPPAFCSDTANCQCCNGNPFDGSVKEFAHLITVDAGGTCVEPAATSCPCSGTTPCHHNAIGDDTCFAYQLQIDGTHKCPAGTSACSA